MEIKHNTSNLVTWYYETCSRSGVDLKGFGEIFTGSRIKKGSVKEWNRLLGGGVHICKFSVFIASSWTRLLFSDSHNLVGGPR